MTFLNTSLAARDDRFRGRVAACVYKLAQDVLNEATTVDDYAIRHNLAVEVIREPMSLMPRFTWVCASNPSVSASVSEDNGVITVAAPDGDLEFVCASNWTILAQWWHDIQTGNLLVSQDTP